MKDNMANIDYSVGTKYKLYYNPNNPNNRNFEVRDDEMVVILSEKGNYSLQDIHWFEYNTEKGHLTQVK